MIVFDINHTDYKELLSDLAKRLDLPYNGEDVLLLKEPSGKGFLKALSIYDGLQVLMVDATFHDYLITKRDKSHQRDFILHFDDVFITTTAKLIVDNESLQKTNIRHSVARLTSNLFVNTEEIPPNIHLKSIKILFTEDWLRKYLGLDANTSVLQQYLSLKTESFDIEKLDETYLKLMHELWNSDTKNPLHKIYISNRLSLLIERFFKRLYGKKALMNGEFKISDEEINRLIKAEQTLLKDFRNTPPTIEELAKMVSMSATVFKRKFKEMYGLSVYAYYQKIRMHRAKELLASGKYTVAKTSEAIGYSSPSNFILAFKKMYNKLPSEIAIDK